MASTAWDDMMGVGPLITSDKELHIDVKDEAREYNLAIREGRDPEQAISDYKKNHGYYVMWTHYNSPNVWLTPHNSVLKRTGWMPNVSEEDDPGNED